MQQKLDSKAQVSNEIVESSIEAVNKRCYLGASNKKTNPTGGLNGYYLNIARSVYKNYSTPKGINSTLYLYLMSACVTHTGVGNCGELSGALYLELFSKDLTPGQKKSIKAREYKTNDAHGANSYVLVGETVYDIWDRKKYKRSRLKAETQCHERKHIDIQDISADISLSILNLLTEKMLDKFRKEFDEEIAQDRKNNQIYPTLDNKDPSDYALWASDTIPIFIKNLWKQ